MRVFLKMVAFGLLVGCLNYTGRADVSCDPAGAAVAKNKACNGNLPNICETEHDFFNGDSCAGAASTVSVATGFFLCESNGNNPAPPLLGTRCVDSGNTAICTTMASCTMVLPPPRMSGIPTPGIGGGYIFTWMVQDPAVCTPGMQMPISSPTKTTVACSSVLI